jgi:hypothetical protein
MLTIKTKPDCTLGFVEVPDFKISDEIISAGEKNIIRFSQKSIDATDNPFRDAIGFEGKQAIGKLSEITEEQAKEFYNDVNPINAKTVLWEKTGLCKIAKSAFLVGIEEKDFENYLVIKL